MKNKDFEEWYVNKYLQTMTFVDAVKYGLLRNFYQQRPSEQFGVYQDFYESVGIRFLMNSECSPTMRGGIFKQYSPEILSNGTVYSLKSSYTATPKVRMELLIKAEEIYLEKFVKS